MKLFYIFILFISVNSFAQLPENIGPNLIPNPGFEGFKGRRLQNDMDGSESFRYNLVDWKSPTMTTPDLIIVLPDDIRNAKKQGLKYNETHSGYKCVAILTYHPKSERSENYREYIQAKLTEPLKKDREYFFEFWVCREVNSMYATNNIGIFLSETEISGIENYKPLTDYKPFFNVSEMINKDKKEWVKYSGKFTAHDNSRYIIIGNFFLNDKTSFYKVSNGGEYENAYYLLDDLALHELNYKPEPKPEIKVGEVIKLDRVFFVTAKWDLLPESNQQLDEVVNLLNEYPQMEIAIHGHTDDRGDDNYNLDLSQNRAKSVYQYLINKGIAKERLKYEGFGEKKAVADNQTTEGRQLNRRVEFVVTKVGNENLKINYDTEVKPYTDKE